MRNRNLFKLFIVLLLTLVATLGFGGLANAAVCVPQDAVATTYKTVLNPEYVPAVAEESHIEVVVDEEAWDEQVLVSAETVIHHDAIPPTTTVYPPVLVPAVTHVVTHPATYRTVTHEAIFHNEYEYRQFITGHIKWRDTATWNGYDGLSWGWYYTGNSRIVIDVEAWTEEVLDQPAWDEIVVDVAEYTIPGYEVVNNDGVDAWDEVVPAVYTTVHHEAVTHEETVIDVEAQDAIGEEFIEVVDVEGTPAVVCEPEVVVVPVVASSPPVVTEIADVEEAPANNSELDSREELASTGSSLTRMAPYGLGAIMIGIVFASVAFFARRWDKKHFQQL